MKNVIRLLRNRGIALGFELFVWFVRVKHALASLFRPSLRRVDHVTIPVTNLAVAKRFYLDVLGATHLMTIDAAALARFGRPPAANDGDGVFHVSLCMGGQTRVDLFLQATGQAPLLSGHPHYAFRVAPRAMAGWKQRLDALGIANEGPLQLGFPGQASLYFNDPSGNHLEIVCHGYARPIPIRPPEMSALVPTSR